MRITHLKLKDFGRHKKIEEDLNVPVVGLGGPNASGKTTVLEAIKFAFTGEVSPKRKQETYCRNWFRPDPPEGATDPEKPTNGSVLISFRQDGKEGRIFRQVGKSPRRWLEWDGKKLTKAGEIETRLHELFGANKEARANAVFPPQGSLDKLLFGTPAERQDMFHKLLLLAYMGKINDLLDEKRAHVLSPVQDYTVVHDEAKNAHGDAELDFGDLQGELERAHDPAPDRSTWNTLKAAKAEAVSAASKLKTLKGDLDEKLERLEKLRGKAMSALRLGRVSVAELVSAYEGHVSHIRDLEAMVERHKRGRAAVETRRGWCSRISEREGVIKTLEQDLPGYEEAAAGLEDLGNRWDMHVIRENKLEALTTSKKSLLDVRGKLEALGDRPEDPAPKRGRLEMVTRKITEKGAVQKALESLTGAGAVGDTCPICHSHVEDPSILEKDLEHIRKEKEKLTAFRDQLRDQIADMERAVTTWEQDKNWLGRQEERISGEARSLEDDISGMAEEDATDLRGRLEAAKNANLSVAGTRSRLSSEKAALDADKASLAAMSDEDKALVESYDPTAHGTDENALTKLKGELALTREEVDGLRKAADDYSGLEADIKSAAKTLDERQDHLKSLPAPSVWFVSKCMRDHDDDGAIEDNLREYEAEFGRLSGKVEQAKKHADGTAKRLADIERQIETDKARQNLAADLAKVREAFSRKGLPQVYSGYMFRTITPMVQQNLSSLGADFLVEPDPEEAASYRFMRQTKDGSGWMPQDMMSGGQKVRMSIAFLLAVQQVVTPDVGFLVLDEPSTHIDDEGAEAMKDLFIDLGRQLKHTETQIWVCDHKPELETAFGKTIKLTNG